MKLLAITLLAVCLIQGNSAQLGSLRRLASGTYNAVTGAGTAALNTASNVAGTTSGAASSVLGTASGAASSVLGTASGAASSALNTASNIRNSLSGGAQALIDSAAADVSLDSLAEAAKDLSPKELLDTVQGAAAEIEARVEATQAQIESAVSSVTEQAEATLNTTVNDWNCPVKAAVEKALAAGCDIRECAVDGVAALGKEAATNAVKCVTDKVKEAVTLATNIARLPVRAATLTKDGVSGYRSCSGRSNTLMKRACQATQIAPVAVKSALLVKDTVSYATQAATLVTTLKSQLATCAAGVAAKTGVEAAATGGKIVSCINAKLAAKLN